MDASSSPTLWDFEGQQCFIFYIYINMESWRCTAKERLYFNSDVFMCHIDEGLIVLASSIISALGGKGQEDGELKYTGA